MYFIKFMQDKIKEHNKKVVLPEGEDERIIKAAEKVIKTGIAKPILLGDNESIRKTAKQIGVDLSDIKIIHPENSPQLDIYTKEYTDSRGIPTEVGRKILSNPLYFGTMMVKKGDADTSVAGCVYTTGEVIMANQLFIDLEEGISIPSSYFIVDAPYYHGSEGSLLIFADAGVNPDPTPEQLADIAITTARTAKRMLGWEPKVAMLSCSTKGSVVHPMVDKVRQAYELTKQKDPSLLIDGELQGDAALVPEVAMRKIKDGGTLKGQANILIFPDLDAGNISYKIAAVLAKASTYGPLLQGFKKPVSDLSRGANVDNIYGVITIMTVAAQD